MILRLQADRVIERGGIVHGAHQHLRIEDRLLGLRKSDATGTGETVHLGKPGTGKLLRQRTNRENACQTKRLTAAYQTLDEPRLVERRIGIGRTRQRRYTTGNSRRQLGFETWQAGR